MRTLKTLHWREYLVWVFLMIRSNSLKDVSLCLLSLVFALVCAKQKRECLRYEKRQVLKFWANFVKEVAIVSKMTLKGKRRKCNEKATGLVCTTPFYLALFIAFLLFLICSLWILFLALGRTVEKRHTILYTTKLFSVTELRKLENCVFLTTNFKVWFMITRFWCLCQ